MMAPGSDLKTASASGPILASAISQSPVVQPVRNATPIRGSSGQPAPPNQPVHTQAQLAPAPAPAQAPAQATTPETNGTGDASFPGMPQPDSTEPAQQLPGQPYKDGRIRNPIPSKLKGKTSNASGNFAVMHMDIRPAPGKDMMSDRDAAAKRTSENTALAAKMAFENGYQSHRKSTWLRLPEESSESVAPFTGTTPYNPALYGLKPAPSTPKEKPVATYSPRPLSSVEVKEEQARLLTLLRSLQPVAVVDQLCKALAYFGGVPEAPPPQDNKFPESAEANGSGSVFVGWVAEIFPDLDAQGRPKPRPFRGPDPTDAPAVEKRGRGRPKGSKGSKSRSDKGIKKGPKKNLVAEGLETNGTENDDSWVDVDDTVMGNGQDVVETGTAQVTQTPDRQMTADVEATGSAKKRGRPKGSKNRPKDAPDGGFSASPAPLSALFSLGKKTGRPKGSKNKSKEIPMTNGSAAAVTQPQQLTAMPQAEAVLDPQQITESDFALAALKAYNESQHNDEHTRPGAFDGAIVSAVSEAGSKADQTQPATNVGKAQPAKNRKRKANETENYADQIAARSTPAASGMASATNLSVAGALGTSTTDLLAQKVPPTKRQRNSAKAKAASQAQAQSAPSIADQTFPQEHDTQVSQVHAIQAAPVIQRTDSQIYTSPTMEELEAQLEQHDQHFQGSGITGVQASRQPEPNPPSPPLPYTGRLPLQNPQDQPLAAHNSKQIQPIQQKSEQQQRVMARQRQYQQQQQAAVRNPSPSVNPMTTASPHVGVQSASPNPNPSHLASPNLQQQRISNSQTPTSMSSQIQNQQSRSSQSYYAQATASTQSSYGSQQSQQYASPQPPKQQFNMQQPQSTSNYSAQQTSQPQPGYNGQQTQTQYTQQKQQSYSSQTPQQYASPQQQYSSQQRIHQPQYAPTSSGTSSQSLVAHAPQYGSSTTSGYNSNDGSFRANSSNGINFGPSTYGSNQVSNAPRTSNLYSPSTTNSYNTPTQQISSYATNPRRNNIPTSTSQTSSVHSVQSLPQNMGGFSDFSNLNFDSNLMSGLDNSTGGHSNLGMNSASYNSMGAGNVSRSASGASNFSSLNSFDSSIRNDGGSYFGIRK